MLLGLTDRASIGKGKRFLSRKERKRRRIMRSQALLILSQSFLRLP